MLDITHARPTLSPRPLDGGKGWFVQIDWSDFSERVGAFVSRPKPRFGLSTSPRIGYANIGDHRRADGAQGQLLHTIPATPFRYAMESMSAHFAQHFTWR